MTIQADTNEPRPPEAHQTPVRPAGRANRLYLLLIGVVVIGFAVWRVHAKSVATTAAAAGAAASADARVVPVTVAEVKQVDVPIFLDGLGTVTPIFTVTVKTLVDGQLVNVAFKEGQSVKKGDLLAQVDPRPYLIQLHQAEANFAKDAAQLRNGQLNLDRYKTLRGQNLIPQQQVDDQQTVVDQNAAASKGDQTQIESARLQLDYARITSPIDGVTGVRLVDPGNIIHAADQTGIVIVTQLDPIAVLFTLPEDDLPRVSKQLAAGAVGVDAYSRDGTTKLGSGQLALIDNEINQATATIRLKATFPNPQRVLWPNEFIKARLLLETRKSATTMPATVVQRGPQGTFAYLVGGDQTVSVRPIVLDVIEGDTAILASGLSPGDKVVSDGQNQLRPGAKISTRAGSGPPPASSTPTGDPAGDRPSGPGKAPAATTTGTPR